jgi:hypothetical protein
MFDASLHFFVFRLAPGSEEGIQELLATRHIIGGSEEHISGVEYCSDTPDASNPQTPPFQPFRISSDQNSVLHG